jgi:hypothetical protein
MQMIPVEVKKACFSSGGRRGSFYPQITQISADFVGSSGHCGHQNLRKSASLCG